MICDYSLLITIPAFMFFLGMGITPVPWILLGEWFVSETRSFIGGIGSATFFLSALISLQVGIFRRFGLGDFKPQKSWYMQIGTFFKNMNLICTFVIL